MYIRFFLFSAHPELLCPRQPPPDTLPAPCYHEEPCEPPQTYIIVLGERTLVCVQNDVVVPSYLLPRREEERNEERGRTIPLNLPRVVLSKTRSIAVCWLVEEISLTRSAFLSGGVPHHAISDRKGYNKSPHPLHRFANLHFSTHHGRF